MGHALCSPGRGSCVVGRGCDSALWVVACLFSNVDCTHHLLFLGMERNDSTVFSLAIIIEL